MKNYTSDQDLIELSGFYVYKHPAKGTIQNINRRLYTVRNGYYDKSAAGLDAMVVEK